jgi:hypothetical protein
MGTKSAQTPTVVRNDRNPPRRPKLHHRKHSIRWNDCRVPTGLISLMKSAALELGAYRITVNAIIPGLIDTALTRHRQRYEQAVDDLQSTKPTAVLEAEV